MEQECKRTCPYCGGASSGRYCPDCGQPLQASPKITMKLFWKEAAMSFTSLTPGFWNTFVGLLLHPWEVIRQYIHGQRANLSSPITMMMQLLLYSAFFYTILGHILLCIQFGRHCNRRALVFDHADQFRCGGEDTYRQHACILLSHCLRANHRTQVQPCRIHDCRHLYGVCFFHLFQPVEAVGGLLHGSGTLHWLFDCPDCRYNRSVKGISHPAGMAKVSDLARLHFAERPHLPDSGFDRYDY